MIYSNLPVKSVVTGSDTSRDSETDNTSHLRRLMLTPQEVSARADLLNAYKY